MSLKIHTLKAGYGARKKTKRVGRGNASGHGTFSTRGSKGQRSRSGGRNRLKQKGWRNILLSAPKLRGFHSFKSKAFTIDLGTLDKMFKEGEKVTPQILVEKGLFKIAPKRIKILGNGKISKKIEVENCLATASAKEQIEKAGGKIS